MKGQAENLRYQHEKLQGKRQHHVRGPVVVAAIAGLLWSGTLARAQDPVFEAKGFQRTHRDYFSRAPFESIDTLTGDVILTFDDLVLPGNGGRDLRFQRTYDSHPFGPQNWNFGIAGMAMRIHERPRDASEYIPDDLDVMLAHTPEIELAGGGRVKTLYVGLPTQSVNDVDRNVVITPEFWKLERTEKRLRLPDGTVGLYDSTGRLISISDPFENLVELEWGSASLVVRQHLGAGQTRVVSFVINPDTRLPSQMTFEGRTWTYECGNGTPWAQCQLLTRVTLPTGLTWEYGYVDSPTLPPKVTLVRTPQKGEIQYRWRAYTTETSPPTVKVALEERSTAGSVTPGVWRYTYSPWNELPRTTTIVSQSTGARMSFDYADVAGLHTVLQGRIALIARSLHEPRESGGETELEFESRQYHIQPVVVHSSSQFTHTWGVPELSSRLSRRDGRTYTTTFDFRNSALADYHNPYLITESGQTATGNITRITNRTFKHIDAAVYRVGLVETSTTTVGVDTYQSVFTHTDDKGFLTSQTVYGITTEFAPDSRGNVGTLTRAGKTTSFGYSWGVLSRIETPEHVTERAINIDGTVASETQGGRTTFFEYDQLSRMRQLRLPGNRNNVVTQYEPARGDWIRVTRGDSGPTQSITTTTLDGFARPIRILNSLGIETRIRYDAEGRTTYISNPFIQGVGAGDIGTSVSYDALGRVRRRTNADGTYNERSYGPGTVTIRDEIDRITVQLVEAFNEQDVPRVSSLRDGDNRHWTYAYNGLGQLRQVRAPDGIERNWFYIPGTNRLLGEEHPESRATSYAYDASGNLERKTDANGTTTIYTYDNNNRVRTITAGGRVITITYEGGTDRRQSIAVGGSSKTYIYDPASGRLMQQHEEIDGRAFNVVYEYDQRDNVISVTYPSGRQVGYEHDAEGRIKRVFDITAANRPYATEVTYSPWGAVTAYLAGNGIQHQFTYDESRFWPRAIDASPLHLTYQNYDDAGNLLTLRDSRPGYDQAFEYDWLDRLTRAEGYYGTATYGYDVHGNRATQPSTTYEYVPGTLRLSRQVVGGITREFDYDNNGNVTSSGGVTYGYGPHNTLESITGNGLNISYAYDGDNQRIGRAKNDDSTVYIRGLSQQVLTEWTNPGVSPSTFRDYIYAGMRVIAVAKQ